MSLAPTSTSIEFAFKQTLFGIVLMVRDAEPACSPGLFYWSPWRKAKFNEAAIYMRQL